MLVIDPAALRQAEHCRVVGDADPYSFLMPSPEGEGGSAEPDEGRGSPQSPIYRLSRPPLCILTKRGGNFLRKKTKKSLLPIDIQGK